MGSESMPDKRNGPRQNRIMKRFRVVVVVACTFGAIVLAQPLPTAPPESQGFDPQRLEVMHRMVQEHISSGKHAGAITLVARHGKIVDWRAYGHRDVAAQLPMERDTIMRIYSMTKTFTGVAVLQLYEEGRLRLSDPITNWIPQFGNLQVCVGGTVEAPKLEPAKMPITVRMLLNHTAGFTSHDDTDPSHHPTLEFYQRTDLLESESLDEFIRRLAKLPLAEQPGKKFVYSIGNELLAYILERITGEKFDEYCARHIFDPLKMVDTGFDVPEEKRSRLAKIYELGPDRKLREAKVRYGAYAEPGRGFPGASGGAFSTIGDYARFTQMLLNGGHLDGVRVLGRKTVELGLANSLGNLARPTHQWSESDGWGLLSAVRISLGHGDEAGSVGQFSWEGAATTSYLADPHEQAMMLLFIQHFPYDEHLIFPKFHTTVFQALTD